MKITNLNTVDYLKIKNQIGLLILFLIWPFGAFLITIRKFHLKESKVIVYLFLVLFGLTFVLGNEKLDSFRYAEYYKHVASLSSKEFLYSLSGFFLSENTLDIAQPFISFILSRITDDPRLFFGAIAAIFGYFYLKSITLLHDQYIENNNNNSFFFLLFFILILDPIFNINGFRFWTAAWIFFFGAYHVVAYRKIKYLWLCFLSILFHFSFFAPAFILLAYYILGNRNRWYYAFLLASFLISDIVFKLVPQILPFLGEGISSKAGRYANTETMGQISARTEWAIEQGKWYIYLPGKVAFYYIVFAFLYIRYKYRNLPKSIELENIYSFALLFLAFANTISFIPSMGRFKTIFYMFAIIFIFTTFIQKSTKKLNWLTIVGLFPFLLSLIVVLRLGFDVVNPLLFTLLPFPFIFDELSVYQWLFN